MKYLKSFLIDLFFLFIVLLIYIVQLPFTPFVKIFTGKWIMQHLDKALQIDES